MHVTRWMTVNDRAQAIYPKTCVDHFPGNAHVVPNFEGARGNADGTTVKQWTCQPIDDSAAHTVARELACHSETNGSCPYDQNICHLLLLPGETRQVQLCHHLISPCR